jgi:hypothetical protein
MKRIKKISLEQHKQLANELKKTSRLLYEKFKQYETKKEKFSSHEYKALKLMTALRNELDEIVHQEHKKPITKINKIYYGDFISV